VRATVENRSGQSLLNVAHSVTLLKHGQRPKFLSYADQLNSQDRQRLATHLCDSQNQATPLSANPASKAILVVSLGRRWDFNDASTEMACEGSRTMRMQSTKPVNVI